MNKKDKTLENFLRINEEPTAASFFNDPIIEPELNTDLNAEESLMPKNILLVDDDKDQLIIFSSLLKREKLNVYCAEGVTEALQILNTNPIDCVLSDVMMPEPGGLGLLLAIRSEPKWSKLPVIMLTAGSSAMEQKLADAGADMFCLKNEARHRLLPSLKLFFGE